MPDYQPTVPQRPQGKRPPRTRRAGLGSLAAIAVAVTGTLAIASRRDETAPADQDQDQDAASAPTMTAERTVADAAGQQVVVPTAPQRVLALSEVDLDASLALEIKPAGTLNGRGQAAPPRYLGARTSGVAAVGDLARPVLDKVAGQDPDLILAGGGADEQTLAQLELVAPTVVTYKPGEDWKPAFRRIAAVLNKESQAAGFLGEYDKQVQEVKRALGANAGTTVSVVGWSPQGPGVVQSQAFASLVLADLGLKRAGHPGDGAAVGTPLSLEALDQIDGDWLFVATLGPDGEATQTAQAVQAMEAAKGTPAFQRLKAAKGDHVVVVDGSLWTGPGGPLAALAILDDVRKAMAGR
jgi:iron complex transport system substrate-binding protein